MGFAGDTTVKKYGMMALVRHCSDDGVKWYCLRLYKSETVFLESE